MFLFIPRERGEGGLELQHSMLTGRDGLALSLLAMDTSYIPCPVPPVTAVSRQTTLSGDSVNDGGEMHFVSSPSLLAPVVPSPDTTPSYLQPPPQLRETERECVLSHSGSLSHDMHSPVRRVWSSSILEVAISI